MGCSQIEGNVFYVEVYYYFNSFKVILFQENLNVELINSDLVILEIEGKGCHGKVVKAFHSKKRQFFAIKSMDLNSLQDNQAQYELDQCLNEAHLMTILSSLKSPNIISLIQHGFT